jgi:hypothetical protein
MTIGQGLSMAQPKKLRAVVSKRSRRGMRAHFAKEKGARRIGIAVVAINSSWPDVRNPTPECAAATKQFEESLRSLTDFHLVPGDILPATVAGVVLAIVEWLLDNGQRSKT